MGMLPVAAEFGLSAQIQPNLVAKDPSKTFSDTQNYGAASIITQTKLAIGLLRMILQNGITRRRLLCEC